MVGTRLLNARVFGDHFIKIDFAVIILLFLFCWGVLTDFFLQIDFKFLNN